MKRTIYLDNAATSFPKADGLGEFTSEYINNSLVNVNRGTYPLSLSVMEMIINTRIKIASFFDCSDDVESFSKHVIFTSGITESLNVFLRGLLDKGDHVVVDCMQHHAVMRTLEDLKVSHKIEYSVVSCNKYGQVSVEDISRCIKANTKAVVINHASNVFGAINNISAIGKYCHDNGIYFCLDTAQTAGTIDISMRKSYIDFLAFSGHKGLLALQGVGGFIVSEELSQKIRPLITGGTGSESDKLIQPQFLPDKFESGTLNILGIASMNYSLSFLEKTGIKNIRSHEMKLRHLFIDKITKFDGVKVYFDDIDEDETTALVSLSFNDYDNAIITDKLINDYGIMVRDGFHCAYLAHKHIDTTENGTIRFSFGYKNTEEEINYVVESLEKILREEKKQYE